jgi:hypothetical protein
MAIHVDCSAEKVAPLLRLIFKKPLRRKEQMQSNHNSSPLAGPQPGSIHGPEPAASILAIQRRPTTMGCRSKQLAPRHDLLKMHEFCKCDCMGACTSDCKAWVCSPWLALHVYKVL